MFKKTDLRGRMEGERERALRAQAERLERKNKQELEAMRLKFKMMSNAGAIDSSSLRSPTASESETSMAAALSMSPRRSDALDNIR